MDKEDGGYNINPNPNPNLNLNPKIEKERGVAWCSVG